MAICDNIKGNYWNNFVILQGYNRKKKIACQVKIHAHSNSNYNL